MHNGSIAQHMFVVKTGTNETRFPTHQHQIKEVFDYAAGRPVFVRIEGIAGDFRVQSP
jgi:hypothetical protein